MCGINGAYELYAGVVEDADAGGGEVGADEQVLAAEVGAQVRQRGLGAEVLACSMGRCKLNVMNRTTTLLQFHL